MPSLSEWLDPELIEWRRGGLERRPVTIEGPPARIVSIAGQTLLNFSSNNYLGLAADPRVKAAAQAAVERFGTGATSSRLIAGTLTIHAELEAALARWKGTEAALVFPSGYMASLAVITCLVGPGDAVVMDRLNHASLLDAGRLSRARLLVYDHANPDGLRQVLKRAPQFRRVLVVTETVFSMDGDLAPLAAVSEAVRAVSNAALMVDEAHATGVFGAQGRGLAEAAKVEPQAAVWMGTLSKALGAQGGVICGSRILIDYLRNRARPFIYTTGLAPSLAAAALAALRIIQAEPQRRQRLLAMAGELRSALQAGGWETLRSESHIIPLLLGTIERALAVAEALRVQGIFLPAIRPPTVPKDTCRLRISLTSEHTTEDCQRLLTALRSGQGGPRRWIRGASVVEPSFRGGVRSPRRRFLTESEERLLGTTWESDTSVSFRGGLPWNL